MTAAANPSASSAAATSVAPTIISQIVDSIEKGVVTLWDDAEALIDSDAAKVKAVLPASAQPAFTAGLAVIKQGASDALTMGAGLVAAGAPAAVTAVEVAADTLLTTYTGPLAPKLTLATNDVIDEVTAPLIAALQAWALKRKAAAAEAVAV